MKKFFTVAALGLIGLMAVPARAAISIRLTDGVGPVTTCSGPSPSLTCTSSDAAYTVTIVTTIDNVPGGTIAEQGSTLNISSTALATSHPLTLEVASTGFTMPTGPISAVESVTANNPGATVFGTVTNQAYISLTNTAFDTSGPSAGPSTVQCLTLGGAGCGAGGAWLGTAKATGSGTITTTPYALNQVMKVTVNNAGISNFSNDVTLTSVPEPASVVLLGTMLLGTTAVLRKKFKRA